MVDQSGGEGADRQGGRGCKGVRIAALRQQHNPRGQPACTSRAACKVCSTVPRPPTHPPHPLLPHHRSLLPRQDWQLLARSKDVVPQYNLVPAGTWQADPQPGTRAQPRGPSACWHGDLHPTPQAPLGWREAAGAPARQAAGTHARKPAQPAANSPQQHAALQPAPARLPIGQPATPARLASPRSLTCEIPNSGWHPESPHPLSAPSLWPAAVAPAQARTAWRGVASATRMKESSPPKHTGTLVAAGG